MVGDASTHGVITGHLSFAALIGDDILPEPNPVAFVNAPWA